jgi:hypothetical protein
METVDIGTVLTVGGNAAAVAVLLERIVWPALALPEPAKRRYGALIAVGTGIVLALVAAAATALAGTPWAPIGEAVAVGAVGGATAVVAHDTLLREDPRGDA